MRPAEVMPGTWLAYFVRHDDGALVVFARGSYDEVERAQHDHYGRDGVPDGHPDRFFRSMGCCHEDEIWRVWENHR